MYKSNPKHTCSGGFTEVTTELKIPPIHGQSFSGCREDLCFRSWDWKFSRGWAFGHEFEATEFHMVEKNRSPLCAQDNPVGTRYSYMEDDKLFVKIDDEVATDLTTLLIEIFNNNESLQNSPLFIVAESYGGKFAITVGLSALKVIEDKKLKLKLGGVALGDSWISPEDSRISFPPVHVVELSHYCLSY